MLVRGSIVIDDFYIDENSTILLEVENFSEHVWECACGGGHLSDVLKAHGYDVKSSDLIDRGYEGTEIKDFLLVTQDDIKNDHTRDIITNPPYKFTKEFVEHALELSPEGTKIAMFLKIQFLIMRCVGII